MFEVYRVDSILIAINHIQEDVPLLIGSDWHKLSKDYFGIKERLTSVNDLVSQKTLVYQLLKLLEPYDGVIQSIKEEIASVDETRKMLMTNMESFGRKWHLDEEEMNFYISLVLPLLPSGIKVNEISRHLYISPHGINNVKSVKLSNIDMGVFVIGSMVSTLATAAIGAIEKYNPLIIALGILTTILNVAQASTVKIDEQEGSVLWGLILAKNSTLGVDSDRVFRFTNLSRENIGLEKLEKKDIIESLNKLRLLKVVKKVRNGTEKWELIESFEITNDK